MKTYEEALKIFCGPTPKGETPSRKMVYAADHEAVEQAGFGKYRGLSEEIRDHPHTMPFIRQYVVALGPLVNYSPTSLALSMFINGIILGMEMERQELEPLEEPK